MFGACGGGTTDDSIKITSITPNFAPLSGGTRVVIAGQGFLRDGAAPNRVVFGTNEAPLAAASDDATLEVDTPPNTTAGDVPVIVFNRNGNLVASSMFHYSASPTVATVAPSDVPFDSLTAQVTVTGTGFKDENAGPVQVLVDGTPAVDVNVVSDTQLTFTSPPGKVLRKPSLQVTNARGTATKDKAFRYVLSSNPTLILFTKDNTSTFAFLYDTVTGVTAPIASVPGGLTSRISAVYTDASGAMWAMVHNPNKFGQLDLDTQSLIDPVDYNNVRVTTMVRSGSTIYATTTGAQFGTWDPTIPDFTQISTTVPCCGVAMAFNGATLFAVAQASISTINMTTGVRGATVALSPNKHVGEMRFVGNTLYAMTNGQNFGLGPNGDLVTINPTSGAVTVVKSFSIPMSAMEVAQ